MSERITSVDNSANMTVEEAAVRFADTWWPEPRKIHKINGNGPLSAVFTLVDGKRVYDIWFDQREHGYVVDARN